jgi:hypothetical protein
MPAYLIFIAIGLSLAWLVSEFYPYRGVRILLAVGLLMFATFVSCVGTDLLCRFQYNAWYGSASADLIDTTIAEIEAGRSQALLPRLKELRESFRPTYENRNHYDEKVAQFVRQVQLQRPRDSAPASGTHP